MSTPLDTITKLYTAFADLDPVTMTTCYTAKADFHDPVFDLLGRREIGAMWTMLCDSARSHSAEIWRVKFNNVRALESTGSAHWEADYLFSKTGRKVHNIVDASFHFDADALISSHRDSFSFYRWSGQALGASGHLLGWTPRVQKKVRAQAASNLRTFLATQVPPASG